MRHFIPIFRLPTAELAKAANVRKFASRFQPALISMRSPSTCRWQRRFTGLIGGSLEVMENGED